MLRQKRHCQNVVLPQTVSSQAEKCRKTSQDGLKCFGMNCSFCGQLKRWFNSNKAMITTAQDLELKVGLLFMYCTVDDNFETGGSRERGSNTTFQCVI